MRSAKAPGRFLLDMKGAAELGHQVGLASRRPTVSGFFNETIAAPVFSSDCRRGQRCRRGWASERRDVQGEEAWFVDRLFRLSLLSRTAFKIFDVPAPPLTKKTPLNNQCGWSRALSFWTITNPEDRTGPNSVL